ncbi:hypothetical protein B484DRAFT_409694, partial [Ochromonadaceae sp. CCMP2298]
MAASTEDRRGRSVSWGASQVPHAGAGGRGVLGPQAGNLPTQQYPIPHATAVSEDVNPGATVPRGTQSSGNPRAVTTLRAEREADNVLRAVSSMKSPGAHAPKGSRGSSATRALKTHDATRGAGNTTQGKGAGSRGRRRKSGSWGDSRHPPDDGEADMGPRVVELEDDQPLQPDPDPPAHTPAEPSEDYDENEAFIPPELLCTLEQLQQRISVLFPQSADAAKSRRAIALIGRAYRRVAYQYNMLAAIEAVGEFHFPPEALARDAEEFAAAGEDLDLMCALRIAARHTARLNPSRVLQCISADNPQRELLLEFSTKGVDVRTILPPAEFQHNGDDPATWPRQTADYRRASSVVNSLLWKSF